MKSTRTETEENEYPKLKINRQNTIMVLFTSRDDGFIVNSLADIFPLGCEDTYWSEDDFTTYKGTVTLEN